jgi:hypothetical protein
VFTSPDPARDGTNLYSNVYGNPMTSTDWTGLFATQNGVNPTNDLTGGGSAASWMGNNMSSSGFGGGGPTMSQLASSTFSFNGIYGGTFSNNVMSMLGSADGTSAPPVPLPTSPTPVQPPSTGGWPQWDPREEADQIARNTKAMTFTSELTRGFSEMGGQIVDRTQEMTFSDPISIQARREQQIANDLANEYRATHQELSITNGHAITFDDVLSNNDYLWHQQHPSVPYYQPPTGPQIYENMWVGLGATSGLTPFDQMGSEPAASYRYTEQTNTQVATPQEPIIESFRISEGYVGTYGNLKALSENSGLEIHESPSRVAQQKAFIRKFVDENGRAPTLKQINDYRKGNPSIALKPETHSYTDPYAGGNTRTRSTADSRNLDQAAARGAQDVIDAGKAVGQDFVDSAKQLLDLYSQGRK